MKRLAFKMKLFEGCELEYKKRHDALWPELKELLKATGVSEYSIFLDRDSLTLFGVLKTTNPNEMTSLAEHPVMKRWWEYMKDIMESNLDNSPKSIPLEEIFYLP